MRKKGVKRTLSFATIGKDIIGNILYIFLGSVAAVLAVIVIQQLTYSPVYTSEAVMYVRPVDSSEQSPASYSNAEKLAVAFEEVISDDVMKDKLASESDIDLDGVEFFANALKDTHFVSIGAEASDPISAKKGAELLLDGHGELTGLISGSMELALLSAPVTPTAPSNSVLNTRLTMWSGIVAFALLTSVFALISFLADTISTVSELESRLGVPVIGSVVSDTGKKSSSVRVADDSIALLITNKAAGETFKDNINSLAARFEYLARGGSKTVMVSSFGTNEGKSTLCANVALALAESGLRVLLVDADMRNSSQYRIFDLKEQRGRSFIEFMKGSCSFDDAAVTLKGGAVLLPVYEYIEDSAEILGTSRFEHAIDSVSDRFDIIIVDTPPTAFVADAEIIAGKCACALLVVHSNVYSASSILSAVEALEQASPRFCGCILNGTAPQRSFSLRLPREKSEL